MRNRSNHAIGTLVLIDGIPHNVVGYTTKKGSLVRVTVRSWAGADVVLSAYKFRKMVTL